MPGRDWSYHGGDPGGSRYSTLSQINADNVRNLRRAWVFRTGHTSGTFETTPLVIDGVMYITAPNGVFAIDARHRQGDLEGTRPSVRTAPPLGASTRGVQYWPGQRRSGPAALHSHVQRPDGACHEDR